MQNINTLAWSQLKFGKFITEENGPIVKGEEHKVTGVSPSVPEAFKTVMVPSVLGIGNNDRTNWREFTWHKTGGMTLQVQEYQGDRYIIAGKISGRSESGRALGRMYTEAHYACIPASEHAFPSVLGLYQTLHTTPQIKDASVELPTLEIQHASVELSENWLEFVAPVLRILLSGLSLSIKTTRRKMPEMVEFVHTVQSCLPNTLAWRLTCKIGALECPPDEAVLSFVESSPYEVPRMIGFSISNPEKNIQKLKDIVGGELYPDTDNTLIGERYIEYLREHCGHCKNTLELQAQVRQDFPKLQQWDYFEPDKPLQIAGVEFLQVLFEDDALKQLHTALDEGGQFPSLSRFFHRKKEALSLLLKHVWSHPQVVLQSLSQWKTVWQELSLEASAELSKTMDLLMPNRVFSQASFTSLSEDIPEAFHATILDNLNRWIDDLHRQQSSDDTVLPHLLANHSDLPDWIKGWIASRQTDLALMLRYTYKSKDVPSILPFGIWLNSVSTTSLLSIHNEDTIGLLDALQEQPKHLQQALVEELYPHSPLSVIQWVLSLKASAYTDPTSKLYQIQNWETVLDSVWTTEADKLFVEFANVSYNPSLSSKLLERLVAEQFASLSAETQDALWPLLSKSVSNTVAHYRFGRESETDRGKYDPLFLSEFPTLYSQGHAPLQPIFVDIVDKLQHSPQRTELLTICKKIFTFESHTHPLPQVLKQISAENLQSISGIEPKWVRFWARELNLQMELSSIEHNDALCRFFFQLQPTEQQPSPRLLVRLLKEKTLGSPTWTDWANDLQEAKWDGLAGWRVLFMENTPGKPLVGIKGNTEKMLFEQGSPELKAKLLKLGLLGEPTHFSNLTLTQFGALSHDAQNTLVWYGLHFATDQTVQTEQLVFTVVRGWILALSTQERTQLRSEVSSTFSVFSSLIQQVSDYFEETPTTLPTEFTAREWVKAYLLSLPKKERLSLLVD